ncbi:MAG: hypothetical protein J6Q05_05675, partial [Elusimicrobiaceae bacterium]|nr:hypothetical protein [Elusimicrobiaceae bacterium]
LIFPLFFSVFPLYGHETVAPYLPAQEKKANAKTAPITVQYPYEKMRIPRGAKEIFIFGQVNLPQPVTLDINGQAVEVYKNGAFVAFLPVENGDFAFVLTAKSGNQTV